MRRFIPFKVAPSGFRFANPLFVLSALIVWFMPKVALLFCFLGVGVLWFHRDPERTPPSEGIVAPADGRVLSIAEDENGCVEVSVFMNLTDVHVIRAPAPIDIKSVKHSLGRYFPAFTKESDANEHLLIDCDEYEVLLIAGVLIRRITSYVAAGEFVEKGGRLGHISFSSRTVVRLPGDVELCDIQVSKYEKVKAGETILAS